MDSLHFQNFFYVKIQFTKKNIFLAGNFTLKIQQYIIRKSNIIRVKYNTWYRKSISECFCTQITLTSKWVWCVSNHQPHHCLLNCLFGHRSKKTSKLWITGLCARNSLVTGEFPAQMASNTENVSIWWCHHASIFVSGIYQNTSIFMLSINGGRGLVEPHSQDYLPQQTKSC